MRQEDDRVLESLIDGPEYGRDERAAPGGARGRARLRGRPWGASCQVCTCHSPSAALILFLAFTAMASGPGTDIKMFATALATGILVDATVIRALIVPAVVLLMGRWNWWLPKVPARMLRVEPSLPPSAALERR